MMCQLFNYRIKVKGKAGEIYSNNMLLKKFAKQEVNWNINNKTKTNSKLTKEETEHTTMKNNQFTKVAKKRGKKKWKYKSGKQLR